MTKNMLSSESIGVDETRLGKRYRTGQSVLELRARISEMAMIELKLSSSGEFQLALTPLRGNRKLNVNSQPL